MEAVLKILNELVTAGVISEYAIGGAMAAVFHTEPVMTDDLDIFILLPVSALGLITLSPLYAALEQRGWQAQNEFVMIAGIPVQFLPAYNGLVEEALAEADTVDYASVRTRVLSAEHLMAIMLQTGRPKDSQRLQLFVNQATWDPDRLRAILTRHGLAERWRQWQSLKTLKP